MHKWSPVFFTKWMLDTHLCSFQRTNANCVNFIVIQSSTDWCQFDINSLHTVNLDKVNSACLVIVLESKHGCTSKTENSLLQTIVRQELHNHKELLLVVQTRSIQFIAIHNGMFDAMTQNLCHSRPNLLDIFKYQDFLRFDSVDALLRKSTTLVILILSGFHFNILTDCLHYANTDRRNISTFLPSKTACVIFNAFSPISPLVPHIRSTAQTVQNNQLILNYPLKIESFSKSAFKICTSPSTFLSISIWNSYHQNISQEVQSSILCKSSDSYKKYQVYSQCQSKDYRKYGISYPTLLTLKCKIQLV